MTSNGWAGTEPEYKAAEIYFAQTPRPTNVLIGVQGNTTTTLTTALTSGTAYTSVDVQALEAPISSGDTITIGTGATTQTVTASAAAAIGATTIDVNSFTANAAYAVGTTISAAESILEAVQACRNANTDWYASYVCGAADADIEAVAQFIEGATPASVYFYETSDAAVLNGTSGNLMETLQSDKYQRTFGLYSTSQYAGAGVMGVAMGLNTGLANSAFTMAYKSLTSVTPEVLTTNQVSTITGYNGNVYTNYGAKYNLVVQGTMADGTSFDQVINLDQLTADIQTAAVNVLTGSPKVPQTDAGVTILVDAVNRECANAVTRGVLAPGIWNAAPVLGLQTGTNLPLGYLVLADAIANQSQTDRQARKSPPIYACVKMAGAIEHVVIGLIVNQ